MLYAFIILSFVIVTIGIAYYSWRKTKGIDLATSDGYFLGGRSLTGIAIGSSMLLTNLSTEQLVGQNGQTFGGNFTAMAWEVTSPLALFVLAFLFLPRYLKTGITTIPDFLEQRFDMRTRQFVSVLFILGYMTSFLPTVLYSGALVLDSIFNITGGLHISTFWAVALIAGVIGLVSLGYVVFGGLRAISAADTLYGIALIISGICILLLGLWALGDSSITGGIDKLINNHPEKLNAIDSSNDANVPWPTIFTGLLVNNLFYWAANQAIVQKSLGAKNLAEGQKGVLLTGFFKLFGILYLLLPGTIAFHLYGDSLKTADDAYPTLIIDLLPTAITGIFAAILFGAILSSFNGALSSTMTLFTLDLYKPIFRKNATDSELVKAGRLFAITVGVISIIIAPFIIFFPSGLYNYLQEMFGFINVPIVAAIFIGFFTKRVPAFAVKIAIVTHLILYGLSKLLFGEVHFLYVLAILFPFSLLLMIALGKWKPRKEPYVLRDAEVVDMTPWKYAKPFAIFITICIIGLYILFSPWGIAA
ncbi:solute:Na+ symporter, SSS family [Terribacillus halophilus]|uniref:Solute:Na+ symporter, SSS family n=1 Tax=Terribacillus halophilus TaxID=361279 RepID=A0A1G6JE49_9BACI|nr:solute:sodium symporter family transporter [Terribacillus halophilus]SDC17064.1 solute:Na+ symporter, SSS family [Terribacillus halophilus]